MKGRSSTNTFIDTIIRKFDQQNRNYCLVNANVSARPIIYCNDGFCDLTGFSRSEILQKPGWCEFLCGQLTSNIGKQHLREYLSSAEEHQLELLCYKKSGSRFICSILVAPVKAENSEVILHLLSFEDITAKQGSRLFGSKAAGFQWPSSLTGALNRVGLGRGPRGMPSAANLQDITSAPGSVFRKPPEGIDQMRDRRSASLAPTLATGRRQSILLTFGEKLSSLSSDTRRGLAGMLPAPSFGSAGGLLGTGATDAGASTTPTGTQAGTQQLAVSIAAVTGDHELSPEQHLEQLANAIEAQPAPHVELPPTYGRFMDKITNFRQKFVHKAMRWVSAESHPDHKLSRSGRMPRLMMLHYSPFKAVWDWVILFFVLYTAIFTPYSAAFLLQNEHGSKNILEEGGDSKSSSSFEIFNILEFVVDVMFILDIFINFRTTYVNKADEVVTQPSKIAIHYLKGMFLIDAIAAIPFDLLLFIGSKSDETTTLVGLLKTVRLIRLVRVARKWNKVSEYGAAVLILLMATFTLIAHWMACIWYAIATVERPYLPEPKIGWLDDLSRQTKQYYYMNDTNSGPTLNSKYVTALMFTFSSLTSVGFGNIAPNTTSEKIFAIVIMLIGSMMYATIFGNVSAIIQRLYSGTARYHMEMGKVKEFIKFHQIPHPLRQRLEEYFQHAWKYTSGIDMNVVLKSFPECLQADVCLHLNRNLLNHGPAFKKASPGCLRHLSLKFRSSHVPPGDILVHRGDVLDALYFISRGSVEIIRDNIVLAILGKDDIFGEDPVRFKYVGKSSANVRALTYCDLHKIIREDLLDVLEMYPDFAEHFAKHLQITFDLRDKVLAVSHGPSSESNTSDDDDYHGSPGAEKVTSLLDELPAMRIRRRRQRGSNKKRPPSAPDSPAKPPQSSKKAAELRPPSFRRADGDFEEDRLSDMMNSALGRRGSDRDVGGGILEMRPDKAGMDVTPANFDFPGQQRDSSSITGAISSWAGGGGSRKPMTTSTTSGGDDETQIPLLSQQRTGRLSTPSSSTPSSTTGRRPRSPPPVPPAPPSSAMLSHTQSARIRTSWQYSEQIVIDRTGSEPPGVYTYPAQSGASVSGAAITSSATLPDFGSMAAGTLRSTPADDKAIALITETGMRLTATANKQEQRISVIAERVVAMETRLANDMMGILSMLRHSQGAKPSISTLTLTATGTSEAVVVGGGGTMGMQTSRTIQKMPSTGGESTGKTGTSTSGATFSGVSKVMVKRPSLRRGDESSDSPTDSQSQWPPPPSTEEASLNLSVGGMSSDNETTSLPGTGTETSQTSRTTSPSAFSPDDPPVSYI